MAPRGAGATISPASWATAPTLDRAQPVPVSSLTNAVAITAGGVHTCARRADGSSLCWGNNVVGQLGDATNTFRAKPFPVVGFTGAIALAAGSHHTCGSTADHAVACWGLNDEGQLGNGTVSNSSVAQTVAVVAAASAPLP